MTPNSSLITPRSRRIRLVGSLLLLVVIGMGVYGFAVLMPSISRSVSAHRERVQAAPGQPLTSEQKRDQKAVRAQVAFAYAYWGVCGLFVIGALFAAWLDLRELSRSYLNQRQALWKDTASRQDKEV